MKTCSFCFMYTPVISLANEVRSSGTWLVTAFIQLLLVDLNSWWVIKLLIFWSMMITLRNENQQILLWNPGNDVPERLTSIKCCDNIRIIQCDNIFKQNTAVYNIILSLVTGVSSQSKVGTHIYKFSSLINKERNFRVGTQLNNKISPLST